MAVLEQQKALHSGTEVRNRRSLCRERGFWLEIRRVSREQDDRKFENSTWDSHQKYDGVLHLIKILTPLEKTHPPQRFRFL